MAAIQRVLFRSITPPVEYTAHVMRLVRKFCRCVLVVRLFAAGEPPLFPRHSRDSFEAMTGVPTENRQLQNE
jgi:hypothetical protein